MADNETEQAIIDALKTEGPLSGAQIAMTANILTCRLYPALVRLEKSKAIASDWETSEPRDDGMPRRRIYSVKCEN